MSRYDYHHQAIGNRQYDRQPKKKKNKLTRSLFLLVVFMFVISLFIYVFPEVDVILVPETKTVENNFEITVKTSVTQADKADNIFPAKIIKVDDSLKKTFITTGKKNVGEKAEGIVVFLNQTGLVQPLTTENSLITDDGIIFHTKKNIEIPKAEVSAEGTIVYGSMTTSIIAVEAGKKGNVVLGRLTISDLPFTKQDKIYGEIKSKLNGGTDKTIQVVSEEDLTQAQEQLVNELKPKLKQAIEKILVSGQVLNNKLFKYQVVNIQKAVELEEETKRFDMQVTLSAEALVWNEQQVKQAIADKIVAILPKNKKIIETSHDIFKTEIVTSNLDKGEVTLKINTLNQISLPIDIDALKNKLKGLKEYEARRILLSQENIKDVRFKFHYSLTSQIPENGNRINVMLNF